MLKREGSFDGRNECKSAYFKSGASNSSCASKSPEMPKHNLLFGLKEREAEDEDELKDAIR